MRSRFEKVTASYFLGSGAVSCVLALLVGWLIATGRDPMGGGPVRIVGWGFALLTYATMFVAGILVLRRSRLAEWLVPLVLAIQIPIVEFRHFSYALLSFPKFEWGLLPLFGPTISADARMAITVDGRDRPFSIAINAVAIIFFLWADKHYGQVGGVAGRAG